MRVGLLIETATHLSLALTTSPAVALVTLVVFGAHAFVWGTTSTVVRQRAVPDELLGRVTGVYRVAIMGGLVDRHADRRPAGAARSGSPRRSGSGSSAPPCWSSSCGASSTTSSTPARSEPRTRRQLGITPRREAPRSPSLGRRHRSDPGPRRRPARQARRDGIGSSTSAASARRANRGSLRSSGPWRRGSAPRSSRRRGPRTGCARYARASSSEAIEYRSDIELRPNPAIWGKMNQIQWVSL